MIIKRLVIFATLFTLFTISGYSQTPRLRVVKQGEGYTFSFHPVNVKGVIENMRYFYDYRIKISAQILKPVSIYKIVIILPSDSSQQTAINTPIFLHPGKFILEPIVRRRDNIDIPSFTIRFYFNPASSRAGNPPAETAVRPQTEPPAGQQNNAAASTDNEMAPSEDYTEYVIKKSDYAPVAESGNPSDSTSGGNSSQ